MGSIQPSLKSVTRTNQTLLADIGCGTGFFAGVLLAHGYRVIALDGRVEAIRAAHAGAGGAGPGFFQADATRLPLPANGLQVVTSLDVIEHLDDRALLLEIARTLQPGGVALLTTPAIPWLWSYRDEAAGHLRRYTPRTLRAVVAPSGLIIRDLRYYQCLLFPVVVAARLLGRRQAAIRDREDRPAPIINTLFKLITRLELAIGQFVRWPIGSSLVIVLQKPTNAAPGAGTHS
jgi:2-polyprenyl-3-methyl-5-hydroxy-6-metoxy-1,4-benzoquinol methylase